MLSLFISDLDRKRRGDEFELFQTELIRVA